MSTLFDLDHQLVRSFWWDILRGGYLSEPKSLLHLAQTSKAFYGFIESFDFVVVRMSPARIRDDPYLGCLKRCESQHCSGSVQMNLGGSAWLATFRKDARTVRNLGRSKLITETLKRLPSPYLFVGHNQLIVTAYLLLHSDHRQRHWEVSYVSPFWQKQWYQCPVQRCGRTIPICEIGVCAWCPVTGCCWCVGTCHLCSRQCCRSHGMRNLESTVCNECVPFWILDAVKIRSRR